MIFLKFIAGIALLALFVLSMARAFAKHEKTFIKEDDK